MENTRYGYFFRSPPVPGQKHIFFLFFLSLTQINDVQLGPLVLEEPAHGPVGVGDDVHQLDSVRHLQKDRALH